MLPLRQATFKTLKSSLQTARVSTRYQSGATSAAKDLVQVDVNGKGYAVVTLNRPPVNSLNLELLSTLSNTLDDLEKNKSRGLILTSVSLGRKKSLLYIERCFLLIFTFFQNILVVKFRIFCWPRYYGNVQVG